MTRSAHVSSGNLISAAAAFFEHERYRAVGDAIALKKPSLKLIFRLIGFLSRSRLGNALLIVSVILGYRSMRRPMDAPLFQYGMSANNERVFQRVNNAASRPEWNAFINGRSISFGRRIAALRRIGPLWRLSGILARRRGVTPFSHTQLVLTAAASLVYREMDFANVACVCVASDHSPIVMGLLDAARANGLRICYVQHAPVAEYFPPLDYDLAILFDQASVASYERAATLRHTSSKGQIMILPPFDADAIQPTIGAPPYRIGLCLSYLFDAENLAILIDQLIDHPAVASMHLRRHPRCKADLSQLMRHDRVSQPVWGSLSGFADACDIVLVPNSGVAIELLHIGKPVFYTPGMDYIEYDYYGFVGTGVVPLFDRECLDNPDRIADFFGPEWRQRYTVYDETIMTPLAASCVVAGEAFRSLVER